MNIRALFTKYWFLMGVIVTSLISFSLIFQPVWQLIILAGIFGGLCTDNAKKGSLVGFLGVLLSWSAYTIFRVITSDIDALFDQVTAIILGSEGIGYILIILVIIIGSIMGLLGGIIGSTIRNLGARK